MNHLIIPVTPYAQNCTLLWCEETKDAAIVDPGGDLDLILAAITKRGVHVAKILITHGHIDHAGGAADLAAKLSVPIEGPQREDAFWLNQLSEEATRFGFSHARAFVPERWLSDKDQVTFGNVTLDVLHTPGHTPGHVCYFHAPSKLALVGDVLFAGNIGRTDFPRGDYDALIHSIRTKLWPLGNEITFISGHGPNSTFGKERQTNPFVGDNAT